MLFLAPEERFGDKKTTTTSVMVVWLIDGATDCREFASVIVDSLPARAGSYSPTVSILTKPLRRV
jgi:hypothetical protein